MKSGPEIKFESLSSQKVDFYVMGKKVHFLGENRLSI